VNGTNLVPRSLLSASGGAWPSHPSVFLGARVGSSPSARRTLTASFFFGRIGPGDRSNCVTRAVFPAFVSQMRFSGPDFTIYIQDPSRAHDCSVARDISRSAAQPTKAATELPIADTRVFVYAPGSRCGLRLVEVRVHSHARELFPRRERSLILPVFLPLRSVEVEWDHSATLTRARRTGRTLGEIVAPGRQSTPRLQVFLQASSQSAFQFSITLRFALSVPCRGI